MGKKNIRLVLLLSLAILLLPAFSNATVFDRNYCDAGVFSSNSYIRINGSFTDSSGQVGCYQAMSASNVTVDLRGFTIRGNNPTGFSNFFEAGSGNNISIISTNGIGTVGNISSFTFGEQTGNITVDNANISIHYGTNRGLVGSFGGHKLLLTNSIFQYYTGEFFSHEGTIAGVGRESLNITVYNNTLYNVNGSDTFNTAVYLTNCPHSATPVSFEWRNNNFTRESDQTNSKDILSLYQNCTIRKNILSNIFSIPTGAIAVNDTHGGNNSRYESNTLHNASLRIGNNSLTDYMEFTNITIFNNTFYFGSNHTEGPFKLLGSNLANLSDNTINQFARASKGTQSYTHAAVFDNSYNLTVNNLTAFCIARWPGACVLFPSASRNVTMSNFNITAVNKSLEFNFTGVESVFLNNCQITTTGNDGLNIRLFRTSIVNITDCALTKSLHAINITQTGLAFNNPYLISTHVINGSTIGGDNYVFPVGAPDFQSNLTVLWRVNLRCIYPNGTTLEGCTMKMNRSNGVNALPTDSCTTNSTGYCSSSYLVTEGRYSYLGLLPNYNNHTTNGTHDGQFTFGQTTTNVTDHGGVIAIPDSITGGSDNIITVIVTPTNPQFQWANVNWTNGSQYFPATIAFQSDWIDYNGTSSVILSLMKQGGSLTNYTQSSYNSSGNETVWITNITGLSAGTYHYNFTATDGNQSTTSIDYTLVIASGNSNLGLTLQLNGSSADRAYNHPDTVNASAWVNVSGLTVRLLRNGTIVANGTQATENNKTFSPADYNFTAYFQGNENYTSESLTYFANVSKGNVNVTLTLNGTFNNVSYSAGVTANASARRNTTGEGNLTLYRNTSAVDFDTTIVEEANQTGISTTLNYTACYPESQNYSASCRTWFADFAAAADNPPSFQWQQTNWTNGSQFVNPTTIRFFANFTDDNALASATMRFNNTQYTMAIWNGTDNTSRTFNVNITGLPAGTYVYNFTATDNASSGGVSGDFSLVIARADVNATLHLNGSYSDRSYSFGQTVNASARLNVSLELRLLRNGTVVANGTDPTQNNVSLAAGDYNYTAHFLGNQNYTSHSVTFFANVSKASPSLNLYLNASQANRTYNVNLGQNTSANASGFKNHSEGTITLYRNGTGIAAGSTAISTNVTYSIGNASTSFNYTLDYPATENYSASYIQLLATVVENQSACGTFTSNYTLIGNISASSDCLVFGASNIALLCNGYWIVGSGSGTGVSAGLQSNSVIRNCGIQSFGIGVDSSGATGTNVTNTTVYNASGTGFILGTTSNALNVTAYNATTSFNVPGTGSIIRNATIFSATTAFATSADTQVYNGSVMNFSTVVSEGVNVSFVNFSFATDNGTVFFFNLTTDQNVNSTNFKIGKGFVALDSNSTATGDLNTTGNNTLNLSGLYSGSDTPVIYRVPGFYSVKNDIIEDGEVCASDICTATNWDSSTQLFSFVTQHYSSYAASVCGDSVCSSSESSSTCSADCGSPATPTPPPPGGCNGPCPTITPTPSPSASPTPTPSATPSPTATSTPGPTTGPTTGPQPSGGQPDGGSQSSGDSGGTPLQTSTPVCKPGEESTLVTTRTIKIFEKTEVQANVEIRKLYTIVTLKVRNIGLKQVEGVLLDETLPEGNVIFKDKPDSFNGRKVVWIVSKLSAGESREFTYAVDRVVGASEFGDAEAKAQKQIVAKPDYTLFYLLIVFEALVVLALYFIRKEHRITKKTKEIDEEKAHNVEKSKDKE